jgi:N-acetyl-alpha-D-muramate 1-phosphate uridylyltransferase
MSDILAGFVLAAGAGTRLHPLTYVRPKALCPVDNVALVDHALERVSAVTGAGPAAVAVNLHHRPEQLAAHVDGRAWLSHEERGALGTAGALGFARDWIAGRAVLAVNADAWCRADLQALVDGWDGERIRLGLIGDRSLEPTSQIVASLMPWSVVSRLQPEPTGLYERVWRAAAVEGQVEVVPFDCPFVDCGTPADYLRANLLASGGRSVVSPDADMRGEVMRSVVWDTGHVAPEEQLVDAIRIGYRLTVLVR